MTGTHVSRACDSAPVDHPLARDPARFDHPLARDPARFDHPLARDPARFDLLAYDVRGGAPSARVFRGGCECGAVLYEVALDLKRPYEWPGSVWERAVPARAFRLLTGDRELCGYQFGADRAHHFFCERCGVRSFSRYPAESHADFYSIDLKCLEAPQARPR